MRAIPKIQIKKLGAAILLILWIGLTVLPVLAGETTSFSMEQTVLPEGSPCVVQYEQAEDNAWVGIYPQGQVSEDSLLFRDDISQGDGTAQIAADLSAGRYSMVFYADGKKETTQVDFEVTGEKFYACRRKVVQGSDTAFFFAETSTTESWIGVYPADAVPQESESLVWGYLAADMNTVAASALDDGPMEFTELPIGDYTAYYFSSGDYSSQIGQFEFSVTEPEPDEPVYYIRAENAQPGTAAGKIIFNTKRYKFDQYYYLYWGQEDGILKGYTPLGQVDLQETRHFTISNNLEAPEGADRIYVFAGSADEADLDAEPFVLTMPEGIRGEEEILRAAFAIVSDIHITEHSFYSYNKRYKTVLRDIRQNMKDASVLLNLGDVTNNGKEKEYQQLEKLMEVYQYDLPDIYYIMGNHDYALNKFDPEQQQELFLEYTGMPDIYYSFESQGYAFICLSSEGRPKGTELNTVEAYLSEDQLDWLEEELKKAAGQNPSQPIFVFLHQPLEDTVALSEESSIIPNDQLREILDQYPQVVFFSGHTHCPMDASGVVYDGMGNGASMVHAGCTSQLWDMEEDTYADVDSVDSQGCLIEVYDSYIRICGRNFTTQEWMSSAEYILYTNR